ncbi:MAG: nuclear transport factor 2 family protein [Candidatus Marsarchaeota archaeon]|nr:nuclear transport factor 2 family protein [Candidatus Marsarchaeota archaeon]
MTDKKTVLKIMKKYKEAWERRDPEAIVKIFTKNARYYDRVILNKPFVGHTGIRKYWQDKVVGEQENIKFKLLNLYIVKNTALFEWDARFYDKKREFTVHMIGAMILEIKEDKISSLREYWSSEHIEGRA